MSASISRPDYRQFKFGAFSGLPPPPPVPLPAPPSNISLSGKQHKRSASRIPSMASFGELAAPLNPFAQRRRATTALEPAASSSSTTGLSSSKSSFLLQKLQRDPRSPPPYPFTNETALAQLRNQQGAGGFPSQAERRLLAAQERHQANSDFQRLRLDKASQSSEESGSSGGVKITHRQLMAPLGPGPLPRSQTTTTIDNLSHGFRASQRRRSAIPQTPVLELKTNLKQVKEAQEPAYWAGRFTALNDRFRGDEFQTSVIFEAPGKATNTGKSNLEEKRIRRVFAHLDSLCLTDEARLSLRDFQEQYARCHHMSAVLPAGGTMKQGVFERIMGTVNKKKASY
ncbi:MAG: hypothetical protein M1829_005875 [Trizodia sp. TS-e1964]|nr:MAG: hypothetical protein M1829_005875 [Trizodia sp. TS-e1964]